MYMNLVGAATGLLALSGLASAAVERAATDFNSVVAAHPNLTTYAGLLKTYPDVLKNLPTDITVTAPSDAAFQKFSAWSSKNQTAATQLLLYSVLTKKIAMSSIAKGQSIFAHTLLNDATVANVTGGQQAILTKQPNGDVVITTGLAYRATVVDSDVAFDNGLLQVMDSLPMVPTSFLSTAFNAYNDLEAFLGALYQTGLTDEFMLTPNVTIFVPHNAGFQQLAGTLAALDKAALTKVLRYHMVPNMVIPASELKDNLTLKSSEGAGIAISTFVNDIFIDTAKIIQSDVLIANGVVQMIDHVLNPDAASVAPDTQTDTQTQVFTVQGATSTGTAVPTPFVTNIPCQTNCPTTASPSANGGGSPSGGSVVTQTTGVRSSSSSGLAAPARCTGMAGLGLGVAAAGMAGMGLAGLM